MKILIGAMLNSKVNAKFKKGEKPMSLNEDKIKDLIKGKNSDEYNTLRCDRCMTYLCTYNCQLSKQEGCVSCEELCQSCQGSCERGCQDDCQRNCETTCEIRCQGYQCRNCEHECQLECEKNYQCSTACEKAYQCGTTCESSCQTESELNIAPPAPSSITVPSQVKGGDTVLVQWSASNDSNLAGYILEKKTDSGSYTQIYKGSSRSFRDTIVKGTSRVTYRVKAYDSLNAQSPYITSNVVTVTNNSAPVISGRDTNLGGKKEPFIITVSVNDKDMGDSLDLVAKLNGSTIKTIRNAAQNTNYEIEIDSSRFNALKLNARNEIEISVTDSKATSYRRYYFSRINSTPAIELPTTNFGTKNSPFSFNYTIKDAENDPTSVRIMYGQKVLKHIKSVSLNAQQSFTFSKLDFAQIPAGDISIKIEATDDKGGVSSKIVSFKKEINGCGYVFKKDTFARATQIIVTVGAVVDEKSKLKVSVCNNAKDSSPSWEVITDSLDKIYNFKNSSKRAGTWCVGVKVEITRGKDAGDSYLDAIGINYR